MPIIVSPIFENKQEQFFASTSNRFYSMFKPIQAVSVSNDFFHEKKSDFLSYALNPIIDSALKPIFAIDYLIHLLNCIASLAKALYIWSNNQQSTTELTDKEAGPELNRAGQELCLALSAMLAQTLNGLFSFISLFTRPIASLAQCCTEENEANNDEMTNTV
jgi:hypothetical protein